MRFTNRQKKPYSVTDQRLPDKAVAMRAISLLGGTFHGTDVTWLISSLLFPLGSPDGLSVSEVASIIAERLILKVNAPI
jgi:hypothetical protein